MSEALYTIDELMRILIPGRPFEDRVPGSIKIAIKGWEAHRWFKPHYVDGGSYWRGLDHYGNHACYPTRREWKLWEEPAKLVEHWQAIINNYNMSGFHEIPFKLFTNEDDAKKLWPCSFVRLAKEFPPIMLEEKK